MPIIMQGEPNARFLTSWGLVWLPSSGLYPAQNEAQAQELRTLGLTDTGEVRAVLSFTPDTVQAVAPAEDAMGVEDSAEMAVLRRIDSERRRGRPPRARG